MTSRAPDPAEEARAAESRRAIAGASRDSETLFGGLPSRLVRHFAAADADPSDKAELWGRRIGRALSLAGCLVLAAWLLLRLRGP